MECAVRMFFELLSNCASRNHVERGRTNALDARLAMAPTFGEVGHSTLDVGDRFGSLASFHCQRSKYTLILFNVLQSRRGMGGN